MQRNAVFFRNITIEAGDSPPRVIMRTSVPGYPPADVLAPDTPRGEPPVFWAPRSNVSWAHEYSQRRTSRWNHHMWSRMNGIVRQAYLGQGLHLMDIEQPMLQRVDGHLDELHYCLPGPPDFYSWAVFNFGL